MNLLRLLNARIRQGRARVLLVMCLTAMAASLVIVGFAERLSGNPSGEIPGDLGGAVLAITAVAFGQTWSSARIGRMMGGLSRYVRRALLTSYVALEPAAEAETDKEAAYDALVAVPRGLARLGADLPATLQSWVTTLGCVIFILLIDPVAGAALLLALKLGAIAMAARIARARDTDVSAAIGDEGVNRAFDKTFRGMKHSLLAAGRTPAAREALLEVAVTQRRKERARHVAWIATVDSIAGAGRLLLAALMAVTVRLSGGAAGEAIAMMLVAFLIPLDWIEAIPYLTTLSAAADRLAAFEASLHAAVRRWPALPTGTAGQTFAPVELQDVVYRYPAHPGSPGAVVGPVSCRIEPGQILFVTGRSGAGKTSVLAILAGRATASGGSVLQGGVADDSRRLRDHAVLVTADPVLFGGMPIPNFGETETGSLVEELELGGFEDIKAGRIPPTDGLSRSVRGRVALLIAVTSGCPLILLDEWGAWQSPAMRERSYRTILPRLRAAGRAIVVTTQDERYADTADALIRLEDGRQL